MIGIQPKAADLLKEFQGRALYSREGIGLPRGNSLKVIKRRWRDSFVDILKMDTEGAEWEVLQDATTEFHGGLPVAQLLLQVHMDMQKRTEQYVSLCNLFTRLHSWGLGPFWREETENGPYFWQYAFLSVKHGMFKIQKPSH